MREGIAERNAKREAMVKRVSLVERAAERLTQGAPVPPLEVVTRPEAEMLPFSREPVDAPAAMQDKGKRTAEINFARLESAGIVPLEAERGRMKEEFRTIKRSIFHAMHDQEEQGGKNANVLMVTSTRPGEGKTFTAINLALSIAQERDHSVLLVDADLTRPSILSTLGLTSDKGLVEVLEDPSVDLADVLLETNFPSLTVLPVVQSHSMGTELLTSNRMRDLIQRLSQSDESRIIIFDSPPVLATSEAAALARHVGQIVFAVEAERTTKASVREALEMLGDRSKVGFVLNRVRKQIGSVYFGSYYSSYHKRRIA